MDLNCGSTIYDIRPLDKLFASFLGSFDLSAKRSVYHHMVNTKIEVKSDIQWLFPLLLFPSSTSNSSKYYVCHVFPIYSYYLRAKDRSWCRSALPPSHLLNSLLNDLIESFSMLNCPEHVIEIKYTLHCLTYNTIQILS